LQHPVDKNDLSPYTGLKKIFEKTLSVNKDLPKGHLLTFDDLEAKKPAAQGIAASQFKSLIGKKLVVDKSKYDFLKVEDIV